MGTNFVYVCEIYATFPFLFSSFCFVNHYTEKVPVV